MQRAAMNPITISALTTHLVSLFESDELLRDVWVTGEVGAWKRASSGHVYFNLKDSGATVNAVMWRNSADSHTWLPVAGDQILAHGYVSVYPERGAYQMYVNRIQPAGRGQLYARFEALKAQLTQEGLFDQARKRPIPDLPRRIGVVTSADAAALRDILRVLSQRWPMVDVIVFPTLVQGNDAPAQIEAALAAANRYSSDVQPLDTLILARGGGSIEDLWAFNDPRVAYALAASLIPVVCGVGHETDFTIADFVADLRAATPTAAAAAVVPDRADVREQFSSTARWLTQQAGARVAAERRNLAAVTSRLQLRHPQRRLDQRRQVLGERTDRLHRLMQRRVEHRAELHRGATLRLDALNPLAVLGRGYSIVQTDDGRVVTSPHESNPGQALDVRAAGGTYRVIRTDEAG